MPNRNYQKGYALENDLVNKMNDEYLWPFAIRSAGSHHCADVIGMNRSGMIYFIQCKATEKVDIDLTTILKGDRVKLLERLPNKSIYKCIVGRQKRKRGLLVFYFNEETKCWHPKNEEWLFIYN